MRRIEDLQLFCSANDITLLIDAEMVLQQPVKLMDISQNLICLNLLHVSGNSIYYEYLIYYKYLIYEL